MAFRSGVIEKALFLKDIEMTIILKSVIERTCNELWSCVQYSVTPTEMLV